MGNLRRFTKKLHPRAVDLAKKTAPFFGLTAAEKQDIFLRVVAEQEALAKKKLEESIVKS